MGKYPNQYEFIIIKYDWNTIKIRPCMGLRMSQFMVRNGPISIIPSIFNRPIIKGTGTIAVPEVDSRPPYVPRKNYNVSEMPLSARSVRSTY